MERWKRSSSLWFCAAGKLDSDLPFGHGRSIGGGWSKPADFIPGGWKLSGIVKVQTGFPINVGRIIDNGQSAKLDNPTIERWFNTSVFSNVPAFTFGNTGPVLPDVRTGALRNVDAVMAKDFVVASRIERSRPSSGPSSTTCSTIRNSRRRMARCRRRRLAR